MYIYVCVYNSIKYENDYTRLLFVFQLQCEENFIFLSNSTQEFETISLSSKTVNF